MVELLFLLLPLAFYSGWKVARRKLRKVGNTKDQLSGKFVKGVNYLLNEEPDKALEVFLNYPEIDEYTAETYHLLGNSFRNRGEVDRALRIHQNLIARASLNNKQKQKAMYSLGQDFYAAGMLDRAESVFNELLNAPQTVDHLSKASVCTSLRIIYEHTQEWEKAIEASHCFSRFSQKKSNKDDIESLIAHYYCELADEALIKGNIHHVEQYIGKAKRHSKKFTRMLILEADVLLHQNNYKKAFNKYVQIIKFDSRLFSMLFDKMEKAALKTNLVNTLLKNIQKQYSQNKEKSFFEKIIYISKKYKIESESIDAMIVKELSSTKLNIESIYRASTYIKGDNTNITSTVGLDAINKALGIYLEGQSSFRCVHCGYKMHNYIWRCPACNHWDTIEYA